MKKLIVFDMDGTLADTSLGIINSHRYAHEKVGRVQPEAEVLEGVIGGPLLNTYIEKFGYSEEEAYQAIKFYRSYYAEKGLMEASLYPGMRETLYALKEAGFLLGVATLKAERFVKIMLSSMQINECFSVIYGMDDADTRTKAQLIEMCMENVGVRPDETIMVGDSIHDRKGAELTGVSFVGMTYGFGFKNGEGLENCISCECPSELIAVIKEIWT